VRVLVTGGAASTADISGLAELIGLVVAMVGGTVLLYLGPSSRWYAG